MIYKYVVLLFVLFSFLLLMGCGSSRKVEGVYRTNFADLGFFSTSIKLKPDQKFEYRFRGDLINDTALGNYYVHKRKLFIFFHPEIITSFEEALEYDNSKMPIKKYELSDSIIQFHRSFYIRKDRLLSTNIETEKKVKRAVRYNKRKKYLFFGPHYYKKKWYLQRMK